MAKKTLNTPEAEAQAPQVANTDDMDLQPLNAAEGEDQPENVSEDETTAPEDDEGGTGKSDTSKEPDKKKKAVKKTDPMNEIVEYTFPINYQDPKDQTLYIIVNGHSFTIQRGVTVKVPRYVVECFKDKMKQELASFNLEEKYAKMVNLTEE